jgi:hypothetical protein
VRSAVSLVTREGLVRSAGEAISLDFPGWESVVAEQPEVQADDLGGVTRLGDARDAAETRLNRLLNLVLETAVDAMLFDAATASLRHDGQLTTMAATDQRYLLLDEAQYAANEGPCLDVLERHEPIAWYAGSHEQRWPLFRQTAEYAGIKTSLSVHVPIEVAEGLEASLNLYARGEVAVGNDQVRVGQSFADQVAAIIFSIEAHEATVRLARGLADAMRTRAVIEQAKGILAAEHRIPPEQAFQVLVELSQRSNVKLRDVATRLVDERTAASK